MVCVLASTSLGFYLAYEAQVAVSRPDLNQYLSYEARFEGVRIRADESLLSNVHALMWMSFGLGVSLTLVGLRMLTRPNLDFHPSPPIGSIRNVFENSE